MLASLPHHVFLDHICARLDDPDLRALGTVDKASRSLLSSPENRACLLVCRHGGRCHLLEVLADACVSVLCEEDEEDSEDEEKIIFWRGQQQHHRMRVVEHLLRLLHGESVVEAWGARDLARLHVMSCTSTSAVPHFLDDAYGYGEIVAAKTRDIGPCARSAFHVASQMAGTGDRNMLAWLGFLRRHFLCRRDILIHFMNCRDGRGRTALMNAIRGGMPDVALRILDMPGADVNARDEEGEMPLVSAIIERMPGIALRILEVPGVIVDARDDFGCTPLMHACRERFSEVALRILDMPGVDVNARDKESESPLTQAACDRHACFDVLHTPLMIAITELMPDVALRILEVPGVDVETRDSKGCTPLMRACADDEFHDEFYEVVCRILEVPGVDVNARDEEGWTPLMFACYGRFSGAAFRILEVPGMDVNVRNKEGWTPLMFADHYQKPDIAVRILEKAVSGRKLPVSVQRHVAQRGRRGW